MGNTVNIRVCDLFRVNTKLTVPPHCEFIFLPAGNHVIRTDFIHSFMTLNVSPGKTSLRLSFCTESCQVASFFKEFMIAVTQSGLPHPACWDDACLFSRQEWASCQKQEGLLLLVTRSVSSGMETVCHCLYLQLIRL